MTNTDLQAVRARALASSLDRAEWLRARMGGVTATEVRDIVNRGETFRRDLIAQKTGVKPSVPFSNRYVEWGKEREQVLIEEAAGFGVEPEEHVFHAEGNERFLASPDGLGVDIDGRILVAEVKTSQHDLSVGSPEYVRTGYEDQMQWQMFVTGAEGCVYIWEQHDNDWVLGKDGVERPDPVDMGVEFVARDEERIAVLVTAAEEFLTDLDAGAEEADADPVIADTLLRLMVARRDAKAEVERIEEELRGFLELHKIASSEVAGWKVSYGTPKPRRSFDASAFKADHADLHAQYMRESAPGKPTLRVTAPKNEGDE